MFRNDRDDPGNDDDADDKWAVDIGAPVRVSVRCSDPDPNSAIGDKDEETAARFLSNGDALVDVAFVR
jgi:exosome complex RNA-binding protein Rrp4